MTEPVTGRRTRAGALMALLVLLVGLTVSGCGGDAQPDATPATVIAGPTAADVGFAQDMAVHHDQALLMAQLAITRGSPAVRSIGLSILSSQAQESGALRGWLRLWNEPVVDPHPMAWMPAMSGTSGMSGMSDTSSRASQTLMPGMATPAQMLGLTRSTGVRFDVRFLQLMIRHHLGGIEMARAAMAADVSDLTRESARQMVADQVEDLGVLRALLRADGGHELPFRAADG